MTQMAVLPADDGRWVMKSMDMSLQTSVDWQTAHSFTYRMTSFFRVGQKNPAERRLVVAVTPECPPRLELWNSNNNFDRNQRCREYNSSPYRPIFIAALSKILFPKSMKEITQYRRNYIERKISRREMIQGIRDFTGDNLLLMVLKDFTEQRKHGFSARFKQTKLWFNFNTRFGQKKDVMELLIFASRIPRALDGVKLDDFMNFIIMFMASPEYIRNPYLRAKMVEVLNCWMPRRRV
ncbi:hypothetical protein LXL04_032547 [Taraxacum kok-saghyz]